MLISIEVALSVYFKLFINLITSNTEDGKWKCMTVEVTLQYMPSLVIERFFC
jgi:hypothetical protein